MARASLARSSLAWLHVLQHVYRMMASAGVIIPAPSGGTPGTHVCLLSPSGQRAEDEVARSWTERSRPRGQRPSGQEHECARFNVKRRLGANPRTGFVKVSLTQWLNAGTKLRRWYCVGSGRKYVGAKQVVRGDPLRPRLAPPGLEETDHSGVTERVRPSRQGSEGSVGKTTKGDTEQHSSCTTHLVQRTSVRACLCLSSVTAAGPSGPGQSGPASNSLPEFLSRVA